MFKFKCGCGIYNHNWNDWICHFKYNGFKVGVKRFLQTRIVWVKK